MLRRSLLLATLALLCGCNAKMQETLGQLPSFFDHVPDKGRYIDVVSLPKLEPTAPSDPAALTKEQKASQRKFLANGASLAEIPKLQAYGQSVLDRLIAIAPEPARPARLHIVANQGIGATTLSTGDIYINHGQFDALANEDQLAFVLAHEYSHVLLQHPAKDTFGYLRPYLLSAVDIVVAKADTKDQMLKQSLRYHGADFLVAGLIAPAWSRHQEEQADHLGVDLMVRAGYNPTEAMRALKNVKTYEASYQVAEQYQRNALVQALTNLSPKSTASNDPAPTAASMPSLDQAGQMILAELSAQLGKLVTQLGHDHDDAALRMKTLHHYVDREYDAEEIRPIQSTHWTAAMTASATELANYKRAFLVSSSLAGNDVGLKDSQLLDEARAAVSGTTANAPYTRYAFAQLRASQNAYDKALDNLSLAATPDGVLPLQMELLRAGLLVKTNERDEAIARLRQVGEYYEWPAPVYGQLIPLLKAKGGRDAQTAKAMSLSCTLSYPRSPELCS